LGSDGEARRGEGDSVSGVVTASRVYQDWINGAVFDRFVENEAQDIDGTSHGSVTLTT